MKINGSLVFDASSASEIQNLRVQKVSDTNPTWTSADQGRLIWNTTSSILYVGGVAAWVPLATGGNAQALQDEVDAIETSLGAGISGTGTFVGASFDSPIAGASSFTDAINQLAAYATGNNTLAELDDVTLGTLATGDFLRYTGTVWADHTLVLADVTDVTATAAEVNSALDGITATATELNVLDGITGTTVADLNSIAGYAAEGVSATEFGYLDGVTSAIQGQLDGLQAEDATLTALAALSGTGFIVETGVDTFTHRTLVQPGAGITITNADGVAGNATFALANDLAALEGLATTGIVVRTGDGTATTRTISGTAGNITVVDGNGVLGQPTLDLATVTDSGTGTFLKITTDTHGRVTGTTAVVQGDITALVSSVYVDVTGDTMTGNLVMASAATVTGVPNPTASTDVANKAYVDNLVSGGASWRNPIMDVDLSDVVNAVPTPTSGYGYIAYGGTYPQTWGTVTDVASLDYMYYTTAGGWKRIGQVVAGTRFIIGGEHASIGATLSGAGFFNDDLIQYVSGDPALTGSWTFPEGRGQGALPEITQGTTVLVSDPDSNHYGHTYLYDAAGNTWVEIAGPGSITAGAGLSYDGNTLNVNLGAGISQLPSDEVGIDVEAGKAVQLTSTATNGVLTFVLDTGSGLEQSATGLKISANGITNAMILNDAMPAQADSGSGSLDLGDTLHIAGVSTQGTSVSVNETVPGTVQFIVTASDASSSQKGVATFDATEFTVTTGNVVLGTVPIAKLAANSITFGGTSGSDAVLLGETLTFSSTVTGLVSSTVAANGVALDIRQATASELGVASFDAAHFSVSSGAVSLAASLDDLTNVSTADAAATDSLLTKSAGDWVPVSRTDLAGTIALGDLQDVGTAPATTSGQALIADGTAWQAKKVYHLHDQGTAATSWTVTHNIGQKYCNVTVVDASDEVVIPQSITFNSTTGLTVTFNTSIAGKVVVMGIA